MKAALFFALLTFVLAPGAEPAAGYPLHPISGQAWVSAGTRALVLQRLNAERLRHGLGPLREQAQLQETAQGHADYLTRHQLATHEQDPDFAGFSGRRPQDRARAAGYSLREREHLSEVYVVGLHDVDAALMQLLSGPYHRHSLLAPRASEAGVGLSAQPGLVIELGSPPGGAAPAAPWLLWPHPDDRDIPPLACCERPRPAGLEEFGMPVSVQSLQGMPLRVAQFELRDAQGQPVATRLLQAASDPHLRNAPQVAYLLPLMPLQAGHRYEVRLQVSAGAEALSRHWYFHTRP